MLRPPPFAVLGTTFAVVQRLLPGMLLWALFVAVGSVGGTAQAACAPITVLPGALPSPNLGQAYNQALIATGGPPPYTYTMASGSLPVGLALHADTGVISGVAVREGATFFTIRAQSADGCTGTRSYVLTVTSPSSSQRLSSEEEPSPASSPDPSPSLAVEGPDGGNLVSGAGSNLGTVAVGASSAVRTFAIENVGDSSVENLAVTLGGSHAADFVLTTTSLATSLEAAGQTTFQVTFSPQEVGTRTATLSITSSAPGGSSFEIALTGTSVAAGTSAIQIVENPSVKILPVGGTLILRSAAQGNAGLKFQWKKNNVPVSGVNVTGAATGELKITGLTIAHAGAYKCVVTSTVSGKAATASTLEAQVAIVDTTPKSLLVASGVKTTLTAIAAGNGITYQWLTGEATILDATNKMLILNSPQPADTAVYSCLVTAPAGKLATGAVALTIYDKAPLIIMDAGDAMPPAIVSGTYSFPIPIDPALDRSPTSFSAAGLPTGLTINKTTGLISGKPTVSKAVPYEVTLTATNAKGKSTVKVLLTVSPLPANLAGNFVGILSRFTDLNDDLGGRMELTIATSGTITGKLTLGGNPYLFTGKLDTSLQTPLIATATVIVARAKKTSLTFTFTVDAENNGIPLALITDGTATLEFSGWRNIWTRAAPATAFAGYYTFGLTNPESVFNDITIPQGNGYGSFTFASATGALTVAGKLADGTAYTSATFAGPNGEVGFFQTLYATTNRGSLVGILFIGPAAPATDNTIYGSLSWRNPGTTAKGARNYPAGFTAMDLTVEGAVYLPPVSPTVALGLTPSTIANASLNFPAPASDIPEATPDIGFTIGANSKLTLPTAFANPRKTTLTLAATTGNFSGGFTMIDPDLLNPAKTVTRPGTYSGIIVRDPATGLQAGKGFFLLPNRPAVAGETAANTKIISGKVLLEAE